ncbi:MAG: thioredoxin family protein [Bacteroidales bacterium]|nr:thioredoxin family protein [Bacteroidales bacterium]
MKKKVLILSILTLIFANFNLNSQILEPVKWKFAVTQINDDEVLLNAIATIDETWHLYGQYFNKENRTGPIKMVFSFNESSEYKKIGKVEEWPKPHIEFDDIFNMDVHTFDKKVTFSQKIKVLSKEEFIINGELEGQACLENGQCVQISEKFSFKVQGYENYTETVEEETQNVVETDTSNVVNETETNGKDSVKTLTTLERSKITPIIAKNNPFAGDDGENKSLIWFFFFAMFFGLTALITPCVFPMIPMTVSFFLPSKEQSKRKSRMKSMIFGISIVLIYTLPIAIIIGIANISGKDAVSADFANFISTHWIPNVFFFLIFMIFAASFFGMFEIVLPNWMVSKSDKQADKGGMLGIFFMAFTLVLVSFSCTGPIVGGIIAESTQGGDLMKPIVGMLGFSLGIAIPFTLFAYFPNLLNKLPQSGGWLNSVKVILGFLELALGFKFLSIADQTYHWELLDREVYIAIWIVIFTLMGFYLLGKIRFAHDSETKTLKVPRMFMAIITFSFVIYLIPGMIGAPLKFLSGYLPPVATHDFNLVKMIRGETEPSVCETPKYANDLDLPHGLHGYFDYFQALECSQEQNKPIFMDFTGHGCVNCREMEANVWSDPAVLKILKEDYIILALYVDDKEIEVPKNEWFTSSRDGDIKKMLGKQNADIQAVNFNSNSQPYYVLLDHGGNVLAKPGTYDLDVDIFVEFLQKGKDEFKRINGEKY